MKIFSGFDTNYKSKQLEKMLKVYGEDDVLLLSKSILFYYIKVVIPFIGFVLLSIGLRFFFDYYFAKEGVYYGAIPMIIFVSFIVIPPIIKAYIDYHMDFSIITPKNVHRYDQEGLLSRDVSTVSAESIKTIFVKKRGLLYAIFNNGDIIFFTEGDAEKGELVLPYIPKPESKKRQMLNIMKHLSVDK